MKNKWWEKLPKQSPKDELKYYQTELKVIKIQLMALSLKDLSECLNYVVFNEKASVLEIMQVYSQEDIIKTILDTKENLGRAKKWFSLR